MTRKKIHLLFVLLTLFSVVVVNQSCNIPIAGAIALAQHIKKGKKNKVINEAKHKGTLESGVYIIEKNEAKKMKMEDMVSHLQTNNYVVVDSKEDSQGKIDNIKFVPQEDFYKYYYNLKSGGDFSNAKKGKGCRFKKVNVDMYGYLYKYVPVVIETYWSGDIIDGYINGKGSGLYLLYTSNKSFEGGFCYFEGEYVYGIPISDVEFYTIESNNVNQFRNIKPLTIKKKETDYYLVENRNQLDQAMLDNFVSGNSNVQYEQYKKLANDVRNITANYKKYAEDIILNEKIPQLSQGIGGLSPIQVPLSPPERIVLFKESPEEYNKRHTLEAFKNFEGIDIAKMNEKDKELFSLEQKPLLKDINETLKYMDLLDGLSLTTPDNITKAKQNYNASLISFYGTPIIDRSNYHSILDNAENIAKELKNSSTGKLHEKYAAAEKKINACHKTINYERNNVYGEVAEIKKTASKRREKEKYEIDWDKHKEPSGELVYSSGLFSTYYEHKKEGRISTKNGGNYCTYNIIYNPDKTVNCYRLTYSSKSVDKKDFKSLGELVEAFLKAIK